MLLKPILNEVIFLGVFVFGVHHINWIKVFYKVGLPLLLTLFGINFFALLGIVAIGFAIKILYDNHKGRL